MTLTKSELAEWDRDFAEWQKPVQVIYEVVCSEDGNVITRHFARCHAEESLQDIADDHEEGDDFPYFIRERRCTLAPLE